MSMLKNPRHEAFAQALSRGFSATDAYAKAGFKPDRAHASRLAAKGDIFARVQELNERVAAATGVTKSWVVAKLVEHAENTLAVGTDTYNATAANRALELIGKELGMFIDRAEIGRAGDFDRLDDRELGTLLVAELASRRDAPGAHARRGAEKEAGEGVAH